MRLVTRPSELEANLRVLQSYLADADGADAEFARSLVKKGICFVVVRHRGKDFFAPSRFVGGAGNSRRRHLSGMRDGRETNEALISLIGAPPKASRTLELAYRPFCSRLGITPRVAGTFGVTRKFWDLRSGGSPA